MNPTLQVLVFYALAAATLVSALGVVASRSIVRSAFWLVPCFLAVAGLYLMLGSTFLAAIQVVVYVGAIAVLFLFALMLTRPPQEPGPRPTNRFVWWAALGSIALAVILVVYIQRDATERSWERPELAERYQVPPVAGGQPTAAAARAGEGVAPVTTFGRELMTRYVLPFEITSVLLLAALIGAIVMARKDRPPEGAESEEPAAGEASAGEQDAGATK